MAGSPRAEAGAARVRTGPRRPASRGRARGRPAPRAPCSPDRIRPAGVAARRARPVTAAPRVRPRPTGSRLAGSSPPRPAPACRFRGTALPPGVEAGDHDGFDLVRLGCLGIRPGPTTLRRPTRRSAGATPSSRPASRRGRRGDPRAPGPSLPRPAGLPRVSALATAPDRDVARGLPLRRGRGSAGPGLRPDRSRTGRRRRGRRKQREGVDGDRSCRPWGPALGSDVLPADGPGDRQREHDRACPGINLGRGRGRRCERETEVLRMGDGRSPHGRGDRPRPVPRMNSSSRGPSHGSGHVSARRRPDSER